MMAGNKINKIISILEKIKSYKDVNITKVLNDSEGMNEDNHCIVVNFNGMTINCYIFSDLLKLIGSFYFYKDSKKALKLAQKTVLDSLESYFDLEEEMQDQIRYDELMKHCKRLNSYKKKNDN